MRFVLKGSVGQTETQVLRLRLARGRQTPLRMTMLLLCWRIGRLSLRPCGACGRGDEIDCADADDQQRDDAADDAEGVERGEGVSRGPAQDVGEDAVRGVRGDHEADGGEHRCSLRLRAGTDVCVLKRVRGGLDGKRKLTCRGGFGWRRLRRGSGRS